MCPRLRDETNRPPDINLPDLCPAGTICAPKGEELNAFSMSHACGDHVYQCIDSSNIPTEKQEEHAKAVQLDSITKDVLHTEIDNEEYASHFFDEEHEHRCAQILSFSQVSTLTCNEDVENLFHLNHCCSAPGHAPEPPGPAPIPPGPAPVPPGPAPVPPGPAPVPPGPAPVPPGSCARASGSCARASKSCTSASRFRTSASLRLTQTQVTCCMIYGNSG